MASVEEIEVLDRIALTDELLSNARTARCIAQLQPLAAENLCRKWARRQACRMRANPRRAVNRLADLWLGR